MLSWLYNNKISREKKDTDAEKMSRLMQNEMRALHFNSFQLHTL